MSHISFQPGINYWVPPPPPPPPSRMQMHTQGGGTENPLFMQATPFVTKNTPLPASARKQGSI
jgi:hypothetical protein